GVRRAGHRAKTLAKPVRTLHIASHGAEKWQRSRSLGGLSAKALLRQGLAAAGYAGFTRASGEGSGTLGGQGRRIVRLALPGIQPLLDRFRRAARRAPLSPGH